MKITLLKVYFFLAIALLHRPLRAQLIEGSEKPVNSSLGDFIENYSYKNYRVAVVQNSDKTTIDLYNLDKKTSTLVYTEELENVFFSGLFDHFLIIDAGTSNIRTNYIYDFLKKKIIDTLDIITVSNAPSIKNGKLLYTRITSDETIKKLNLPICDNPDLEFSGYVEDMYYDFKTGKKTSTGKIYCVK